jgi:hypothetical protein
MRFFKDSNITTRIRWYFTNKPYLGKATTFDSRNWLAQNGEWWDTLGEVAAVYTGDPATTTRKWANGKPPPGARQDGEPQGTEEEWINGCTYGTGNSDMLTESGGSILLESAGHVLVEPCARNVVRCDSPGRIYKFSISGISNYLCGGCSSINGDYCLTYFLPGEFRGWKAGPVCFDAPSIITADFQCYAFPPGELELAIDLGPGVGQAYYTAPAATDTSKPFTLTLSVVTSSACQNWPATITVTPF